MKDRQKPIPVRKEKQMRVICDFFKANPESELSNKQIAAVINTSGTMQSASGVNARTVRNLIFHIRNFGVMQNIVATEKGYMYTKDQKKLENYEQRLRREAEKLLRMAERVREWRYMTQTNQVAIQFGEFKIMIPKNNVIFIDPETDGTGVAR